MKRRREKEARTQKERARTPLDPIRKAFLTALATVFLVLAFTTEERTFGMISDEQQMLETAVSIAEFFEIGIARGPIFTVHRPIGDAVSPYGMGQSIVEAVPARLAGSFEKSFGAGSSQTLFVLTQMLLITAAAAGAGALARALGASRTGLLVAVIGTALGSPLWAYASAGYSEPLQAVALVFTLLFAVRKAPVAAGAFAGLAILAKGLNIAVVPFLVLPLLFGSDRVRNVLRAAAGGAIPFGLWLALEIVRFGRPLTSYGGTGFAHPFFDGFWRLLVGVNKGILFYFPLVVVAVLGLVRLARRSTTEADAAPTPLLERPSLATAIAIAGASIVILVISSPWWAWDGTVGWGPRFLVPLVPLLAAAAGFAIGESRTLGRVAWALVGAGIVINSLGAFQPESAISAYVSSMPRMTLPVSESKRYPELFFMLDKGQPTLDRQLVASSDAALSPIRVHLFVLRSRLAGRDPAEVKKLLESPPWLASRPDLAPTLSTSTSGYQALVDYLTFPFRWPHIFSATSRRREAEGEPFNRAWNGALVDQVLRAQDLGLAERAVALSERLFELTPSGYTAALYAESLRLASRPEMLKQLITTLPREFHSSPSLGVVRALIARDLGDEAGARKLLIQVAQVFPRPGVLKAVASPIAEWPRGLHGMTGENLSERRLELPDVGKPK